MHVTLLGHAHVDAVWLWDREETKRVLVETFGRILDLMDQYDDVTFVQTSAQYFEWIEHEQPKLWKRIHHRIRDGRWEIVGGMWIEPDCNMPSGESLCRQLLYGMRYFREKFGVNVEVAWLPDVFGFCWTLPQFLVDAGIRHFFTSKLIWQTRLPFPHNVFRWEGPDGSTVIGYQTPGPYNNVDLYDVNKQASRFADSTGMDSYLAPFGEGDHGGGLREELVRSVHDNPYDVTMRFGNAHAYFRGLEDKLNSNTPTVRNELYLNTHRGTLTTQAFMKLSNRRGEAALGAAEGLQVLYDVFCENGDTSSSLDEAWKLLLFNQFHDALPGSSIRKVYDDARQDYRRVFASSENVIERTKDTLINGIRTLDYDHPIVLWNTLGWKRSDVVELDLPDALSVTPSDSVEMVNSAGARLPAQVLNNTSDGARIVFRANDLPALGWEVFGLTARKTQNVEYSDSVTVTEDEDDIIRIENSAVSVRISTRTGIIQSLFDKRLETECVGPLGANVLDLFQDETTKESAWNICRGRSLSAELIENPRVVEKGHFRATVLSRFVYRQEERPDSTFEFRITVYAGEPIVRFELGVEWHARFVTALGNFDIADMGAFADYEIPYGSIRRRDPSAPEADPYEREKWEVAGLTWVACPVRDESRSIVLLNDSKHGFSQSGTTISMTVLRSPEYPNPTTMGLPSIHDGPTDQGAHTVRYAILPCRVIDEGDTGNRQPLLTLSRGDLFRLGREFNSPVLADVTSPHDGDLDSCDGLLLDAPENIVVGAVKRAEDRHGVIVRFLETSGRSGEVSLRFTRAVKRAQRTNILEDALQEGGAAAVCEVSGAEVTTVASAHSLVSLRIEFDIPE